MGKSILNFAIDFSQVGTIMTFVIIGFLLVAIIVLGYVPYFRQKATGINLAKNLKGMKKSATSIKRMFLHPVKAKKFVPYLVVAEKGVFLLFPQYISGKLQYGQNGGYFFESADGSVHRMPNLNEETKDFKKKVLALSPVFEQLDVVQVFVFSDKVDLSEIQESNLINHKDLCKFLQEFDGRKIDSNTKDQIVTMLKKENHKNRM